MCRILYQLDLGRVDDDLDSTSRRDFDSAGIHGHGIAIAVRNFQAPAIVVEHDFVTALGLQDLLAWLSRLRNSAAGIPGARPDGVAQVATLELDPHARPHVGYGKQALFAGSAIDERRQRPTGLLVAQQARNLGLDTAEVVRIVVVSHLAAILAVVTSFDTFNQAGHDVISLSAQHRLDPRYG